MGIRSWSSCRAITGPLRDEWTGAEAEVPDVIWSSTADGSPCCLTLALLTRTCCLLGHDLRVRVGRTDTFVSLPLERRLSTASLASWIRGLLETWLGSATVGAVAGIGPFSFDLRTH